MRSKLKRQSKRRIMNGGGIHRLLKKECLGNSINTIYQNPHGVSIREIIMWLDEIEQRARIEREGYLDKFIAERDPGYNEMFKKILVGYLQCLEKYISRAKGSRSKSSSSKGSRSKSSSSKISTQDFITYLNEIVPLKSSLRPEISKFFKKYTAFT
jgi:hypothetical protein